MKYLSKRNMIILVMIICIATVASYVLSSQSEPTPVYVTEAAHHGYIEYTVLSSGMLQASELVSVGAQVSGQITDLAVRLGESVKKNQLIAKIDSLSQQNALKEDLALLASLNAQYRAKQAQIKQAQLEYDRQRSMLADHASSKADFESAESNLTVYKAQRDELNAQIQQANISVDSAKVDLGYTQIHAPMDGTVVYSAVSVGQTVNANQTTPTIIELANLDVMTVKAQISEADVIHVKPGQSVYFTILGAPNKRYEGTLRSIEPGPTSMDGDDSDMTPNDDDAVYYNGLFDVNNPDHTLRIGMTAEVSIILNQSDHALLIPSQALLKKGASSGKPHYQVPILVNHQVEYREVTVGINNKIHAEIKSGLQAGDQVIIGMPTGDSFTNRMLRPSVGL